MLRTGHRNPRLHSINPRRNINRSNSSINRLRNNTNPHHNINLHNSRIARIFRHRRFSRTNFVPLMLKPLILKRMERRNTVRVLRR